MNVVFLINLNYLGDVNFYFLFKSITIFLLVLYLLSLSSCTNSTESRQRGI